MEIKEILKSMELGGGGGGVHFALCKSLSTAFSIQKAITKINLYWILIQSFCLNKTGYELAGING